MASLAVGFTLCLSRPADAQNLREPRFMAQAQAGFAQIFNLDYDEAMATFSRLHSEYPRHPAPPSIWRSRYGFVSFSNARTWI
jgi:hypothetical protein